MLLRRFNYLINAGNLRAAIEASIEEITESDCIGWFQNCYYYVPGYAHRPYLGEPAVE